MVHRFPRKSGVCHVSQYRFSFYASKYQQIYREITKVDGQKSYKMFHFKYQYGDQFYKYMRKHVKYNQETLTTNHIQSVQEQDRINK